MNSRSRNDEVLHESVVLVTSGLLAGRVLYSDDDGILYREESDVLEGILDDDTVLVWDRAEGQATCEADDYIWVSYCYTLSPFYLRPTLVIPHQCLKIPTLGELFNRQREVSQLISELDPYESHGEAIELAELCEEKSIILDRVWSVERRNTRPMIKDVSIFLCHASEDKGFVRRVYQDLISSGQKSWMDEAEIAVGQSIIEMVDHALGRCDVFILFLSQDSIEKPWVKKEWNSTLMRKLAGENILFIPAKIDEIDSPNLISDIKYADFSDDYLGAFQDVIKSIEMHVISDRFKK